MTFTDPRFYTSEQSPLFKHHKIQFIQTCAIGGVSQAPYTSNNIAYHTDDDPKSVATNRSQILRYFGNKSLVWCDQIHSAHIECAPTQDLLQGTAKADGIICADSAYVALIMVADCNPILLYDPTRHIFALLHAGRAGMCGCIVSHAITQLQAGGSRPEDLLVFIGSSIRSCCYEIGEPLAEQIAQDFSWQYIHPSGAIAQNDTFAKSSIPSTQTPTQYPIESQHTKKYMLDLIAMLLDECKAMGIKKEHIEILDSCTACDERLFSYRRACKMHTQTGRFGLFASLL